MPWTKDQDMIYFLESSQWTYEVGVIISPISELSNWGLD